MNFSNEMQTQSTKESLKKNKTQFQYSPCLLTHKCGFKFSFEEIMKMRPDLQIYVNKYFAQK
jgi:hypothetical protein